MSSSFRKGYRFCSQSYITCFLYACSKYCVFIAAVPVKVNGATCRFLLLCAQHLVTSSRSNALLPLTLHIKGRRSARLLHTFGMQTHLSLGKKDSSTVAAFLMGVGTVSVPNIGIPFPT